MKNFHFWGTLLSCLVTMLVTTHPATAQEDLSGNNQVLGTGYDGIGAYVDFMLSYYNDDGDDSYLTEGEIVCVPDGGTPFTVAGIHSWKQAEDDDADPANYAVKISPHGMLLRAHVWEDSYQGYEFGWVWVFPNGKETSINATASGLPDPNDQYYVTYETDHPAKSGGIGKDGRLYLRWYVPAAYLGKNLTFQFTRRAIINNEEPSWNGTILPGFGLVPQQVTALSKPTLSVGFADVPGQYAIHAAYATANKFNVTLSVAGTHKTVTAGDTPSDTFLVSPPAGYPSQTVAVNAQANLGAPSGNSSYRMNYSQTWNVSIPAYLWPDSLKAIYDGRDTVSLSWEVSSPGTGAVDGDNFEVQRSTDSTFARDVKTVGTVPYQKTQTSYALDDPLSDIQGGRQVYYRLRRTKSESQWAWGIRRTARITAEIDTTPRPDAVQLAEPPQLRAILSWKPLSGVWANGTRFLIKRTDQTTGETSTTQLTEAQAREGQYSDEGIAHCKAFTYTIQYIPGGGYPAGREVSVPGSILSAKMGSISGLTSSKGYFPDRVELQWNTEGGFDNYLVKRKVYGTQGDYIQVASLPGSAASTLGTDDAKASPGTYYEYMVMGAVGCAGTIKYSDTLHAIGFRSPTGNIYGQVTYESGQPVKSVEVRLANQDATQMGQSLYLDGRDSSYLRIDTLYTPFQDSAFTLEAWIRPDDPAPENQVIFSRAGQYELGFDQGGDLYFSYQGQRITASYHNPDHLFCHVAAIHSRDSLLLMMNGSIIARVQVSGSSASQPDEVVYIGGDRTGARYKGYLDEMSAWNTALDPRDIQDGYTRILAGNEKGLAGYWRFDETIENQFYDLAHQGTVYSRNDGTLNPHYVKRTSQIPTRGQLSLKGVTDSAGNYMITGIPYTGQGNTYTVVPLFGTHQFNPGSVNRLISATSPSFNVNFVDKSSFQVTGHVYYFNSTVPVAGVMFKIDGSYAQKSNGDLTQTDATGAFKISVPVGTHQVQAVKANHVFASEGRITDRNGGNLNYQAPAGPFVLYDSTTIRFIGRVAGGAIQQAYPLGYSLSRNNLGKELKITLQLPSGSKYDLYQGDHADSTVVVDHVPVSSHPDSSHMHHTRIEYQKAADQIVIYPDSLTGEFEADLIPEIFNVTSVTATGWNDLITSAVSLDFTNKLVTQKSGYQYTDSVRSAAGTWVYSQHTDSVFYNDSMKFITRVTPTVSIDQLDLSGKALDYLGDSIYKADLMNGTQQSVPLVKAGSSATPGKYLFSGHPVFSQGVLYHFKIKAFEAYPFYDSDDGRAPAQLNGKDVVDIVPTRDGQVTFYNALKDGPATPDTLSLDTAGTGSYTFTAGSPAVIPPGVKSFAATVRFGTATDVKWQWFGAGKMDAFVLGGVQIGTDFVTAGPNKMLMVLRDPPGNQSYSYAEQGSVISSSSTYSASLNSSNDIEVTGHFGPKIGVWAGVGAGTVEDNKTVVDLGLGVHLESHYTSSHTKALTTTLTSRFQTSGDHSFVGAPADLFVGYSTNITYGQSNNLTIVKRSDRLASDSVILDPDPSDPNAYLVVERDGLNLGEVFGTLFAYPQQHIETVLIPNLIKVRNSFLLPSSTTNPQAIADRKREAVYVSKLPADSPDFGKSNSDPAFKGADQTSFNDGPSYRIYFPSGTQYRNDTILTMNQYVQGWTDVLRENEKQKLQSKPMQNYSFHAGSPVGFAAQTTVAQNSSVGFNIIVSGNVAEEAGATSGGMGVTVKANVSVGTTQEGSDAHGSESSATQGFELAAGGIGEYISVDVNKTDDGGFCFRTKGGETECPYEGIDTTRYYAPGTLIGQPTVQMDKPQITVDDPVVNHIPATQKASFVVHLDNASDAQWSTDYVLSYGNTDSVKGAFIAVDGASIAAGRTFPVNYGQTVSKVLTLTKGPDALDYNNIPIILHSACQYDPTGYQQLIADTVYVSAHFVPSCSNIHVKSPTDNWILNTLSPEDGEGRRYIPVVLDQFDQTNKLFDHIALQYKPSASSQWVTTMNFYSDSAKYHAAEGTKALITDAGEISYNQPMDDASYSDQTYDIRALAVCELSPGDEINTPSDVVTGVKDTYAPRLFGSPQPASGILGITDEIRLNFNEPIQAGLLTPADFQISAVRNGAVGDHSVSVQLNGKTDFIRSEFDKNLTARDITAEVWMRPDTKNGGTLFSQGNLNESMELGMTQDAHLEVTIGPKTITSDEPVDYQPGQWAHVALVYSAKDSTVSAYYNFKEVIHGVGVQSYHGTGPIVFGRSISRQGDYFAGKLHGARIWTRDLAATELQTGSLTQLSGAEEALLAYYPMTEGKGSILFDQAHGDNATLTGRWSTPPGKSISLDGTGYLKIPTGSTPVTAAMDYTLSLWFRGQPGQSDAALISNGKGDGTDPGAAASRNLYYLGFEHGLMTFYNNGIRVQAAGNYLDDQWHHVALTVDRTSASGRLFIDDTLTNFFDTRNLGGLASAYTYLGARAYLRDSLAQTPDLDRYFHGQIDEVRIWNTHLSQKLIGKNNNIRLKGDELGLMTYYPFEKYYPFQGQQQMDSTLMDQKIPDDPAAAAPYAQAVHATISDDMAPIKDRGPVTNLNFDYVVNTDALIINLLEPRQAINKTVVTFKVKDVRDQHGNTLVSPVTWTAFIDQNPLSWADDELNLSKDLYKPLQFESYVVNAGGSDQHFTLDNLPGWLSAYPSGGTVPPEGKQKITFTVSAGLNVGMYHEIAYMRNDNGESESLGVNLKVIGQTPDWQVNPADYQYNMTIYGKIRVAGIFSNNPDDMLGAFLNGKCVGVAHNSYIKDNDLWYVFLTVYSDSIQARDLEFRIWDAGNGKIYQGIPSTPLTFINDAVAGAPRTPIIFDGKEMLIENIPLTTGWNWISFNLRGQKLSNPAEALANGTWLSGDLVKHDLRGFDQYSATAGWIGTLGAFDNTSLFKLKTATTQTLSMTGTAVDVTKTPITLKGHRWNYISYLPQGNMTLKEALAGYEAWEGDQIKSQTGFAMYDPRLGWVGSMQFLEPGKGYMLYRSAGADTSFVYPHTPGTLRLAHGDGIPQGSSRLNFQELPVKSNFSFERNMTVVAASDPAFTLLRTDKVLAYAGTDLRGEAQLIENPVTGGSALFFNIPGADNPMIDFKVERGGKTIAETGPVLSYRSDGMLGSLKQPLLLHFNKPDMTTGIFPNPFRHSVTIRIRLTAGSHDVQMSVYDVRGREVARDPGQRLQGENYDAVWDGKDDHGTVCAAGVYFVHLTIDKKSHVYKVIKQ